MLAEVGKLSVGKMWHFKTQSNLLHRFSLDNFASFSYIECHFTIKIVLPKLTQNRIKLNFFTSINDFEYEK